MDYRDDVTVDKIDFGIKGSHERSKCCTGDKVLDGSKNPSGWQSFVDLQSECKQQMQSEIAKRSSSLYVRRRLERKTSFELTITEINRN